MSYPPGGFPPQQYPPQQPQGYPAYPPQQAQPPQGYGQPGYPPAGYAQQPPQHQQGNWAQPAAPGGGGSYQFADLYNSADHSGSFLYPEEWFDAVIEDASWGRTKDGTKGAWTIKFRTTSGENAGRSPVTMTLSVNPTTKDGQPNPQGMGIMFRQLQAMGVPATPSGNPAAPGAFWEMGWTEAQVAEQLKGKPCGIKIKHDEYDGVTRNKIANIRAPRPGAPLDWPRAGAAPAEQFGQQQFQQYPAPPTATAGYPPQQFPQQGPPPQQAPPGYAPQPGQAGPYGAPPSAPPAQPAAPQPSAPQWGPPDAGAPQFQPPYPQQQQQAPQQQYPPQGPPPQAQFQPPLPPQQANGQYPPQAQQQPQPQPQQGAPELPPWATQ